MAAFTWSWESNTGAWENWRVAHPKMGFILEAIAFVFLYIFSGRWIVDIVRWLIHTGGTVAESAFLLATVYVTINTVAHLLVTWLLPDNVIISLNQISVIAFSVLPELIVFAAIKVCYDHWKLAFSSKRIDAFFWAICYVFPTGVFVVMTVITITSFVNLESVNPATNPQATGGVLVVRCLAGWSYGLLQILFSRIGSRSYSAFFEDLRQKAQETQEALNLRISELTEVMGRRDLAVNALQTELDTLKERFEAQEHELRETRANLALLKLTSGKSDTEMSTSAHIGNITLLPANDATLSTSKREVLKEHLQKAVLAGEKINLKQISKDAGVAYNTARRHYKSILGEIVAANSVSLETEKIPALI